MNSAFYQEPEDLLPELVAIAANSAQWEEEVMTFLLKKSHPTARPFWVSVLYSHLTIAQHGGDRIDYLRRMYATHAWQRIAPTPIPQHAFRRQKLGYNAACKLMQGERWTMRQLAQKATVKNLLALHDVGEVAIYEIRLVLAYQGLALREA